MSSPWSRPATTERPDAPRETTDESGEQPERGSGPTASNGHHTNGHHTNGRTNGTEFARPTGADGSFAERPAPSALSSTSSREPSVALAGAFGRPTGSAETLQRPGGGEGRDPAGPDDFWDGASAERDPWRDPAAAVELGAPAVREDGPAADRRATGPKLSARELLFGRRVAPSALVLLTVLALLVGAVGGIVGHLTAQSSDALVDPGASLAQVDPGKERPAGSVSDVAGRVVPAVVSIEVRSGTTGGTGSGVVIDPRGDIVTNNHVVSLAATDPRATLEAVFASGARAPARIVGRDPQTDIAVIKVDVADPVVAQLGRSADLQVGDGVIAIGSPLGLAGTVTTGIVSSLRRPVRLDAETANANPVIDAIQTDAAINPGNSGGALVDSTGAVVGINTAIRTLGGGDSSGQGGSIGLGFAIPIDDVRTIAESLIRTGGFAHTDLGVNAKSVTDGTSDGAQVLNVVQGGPASRAGVLEGDVVVRVDDRPIASADELVVAIREHRPGDTVTLGVVRGGRPLSLQAQV
ncbi:trypsin-like peptidase domain-containing protein [Actinomycetospora termitidis]|uniref:Trypsin-like peptidase domain-containing protein n=1 Tax=Actinomycetospora termitidis TaxID=3053470 RepID=A0ABT7M9L3_9PSEU|nr:trypsin-like peptidase domain-containing protein [Actinomycetospora sp. Odt1-22]MDL5157340.1 trypsin-like peptidase domain-containing protein [Actinomycetospora sp. Odt1-22]